MDPGGPLSRARDRCWVGSALAGFGGGGAEPGRGPSHFPTLLPYDACIPLLAKGDICP